LVEHDPEWASIAAREGERLAAVLGECAVYHIGSTAIPGIAAKPTIDLMPVVGSISAVDEMAQAIHRINVQPTEEI
jgi:GrpB-like predicted nucleotidyltransferase (UPF0157 family)